MDVVVASVCEAGSALIVLLSSWVCCMLHVFFL